jgi:hypothetical protein
MEAGERGMSTGRNRTPSILTFVEFLVTKKSEYLFCPRDMW